MNKITKIIPIYAINNSVVYIHKMTINEFMEYSPPCNECLVQNMCIKVKNNLVHTYIKLNICDKFKDFINMRQLYNEANKI